MNNIIVGTAGHIDHGKTALIKALNGFEGDQNEEEKRRGITIDLSFSNLKNDSCNVAFIDVPGHENLLKTMISGAYAFDYAMLVVSANEGIMPQSKEHLEILKIFDVKNIILCITKCDLVDETKKEKTKQECEEFIKNKDLKIIKSFFVSTKTNEGIDDLRNFLLLLPPKQREKSDVFHYYIDRVFSIKGAGVVVTGSLISGEINKNQKILNCELNKIYSIKNIQMQGEEKESINAPARVALNLNDAKLEEIKKGQILTQKGYLRGFDEIDCYFEGEISHNQDVLFCIGSKQINAKCIMLNKNSKNGFVTFKFKKEIFARFDERFIVLANSRVVGGGIVLNAIKEPLKKQAKIELLNALYKKDFKAAFEFLSKFHKHGFGLVSSYQRFNLTHESALNVARNLNAICDENSLCVYDKSAILDIKEFIKFIISKNQNALISAQSIALKLSWASQNLCNLALDELENKKILEKNGNIYNKFGVDFSQLKNTITEKIYDLLKRGGISPLAPYNIYDELEIDRQSGDNALKSLCKSKKVIRLAHNLFITNENLNFAINSLRELIKKDGFVNINNAKNKLNLSRKFIICYLEYLDNFDDIVKIENNRIFKK